MWDSGRETRVQGKFARGKSVVVVSASACAAHRFWRGILFEIFDRALHIFHQQSGQIAAEAKPSQHSLHHDMVAVSRQRIRRNLPSPQTQALREIIERESRMFAISDRPRTPWDAAAPVVNKMKHSELLQFVGKPRTHFRTTLRDSRIALPAAPDKVVILRCDWTSRPRKIQRKRRHVAAQILHFENQLFRQIVRLAARESIRFPTAPGRTYVRRR